MLVFPEKYFPGDPRGMRFDFDVSDKPGWGEFFDAKELALRFIRGTVLGEKLLGEIEASELLVEVLYGKKRNSRRPGEPGERQRGLLSGSER